MFQTKEFTIPKKDYFKIFLLYRFIRFWWLYLFILLLAVYYLADGNTLSTAVSVCVLLFIYIGMYVLQTWLQVYRNRNKLLFRPRTISIESDRFRATTVNDTIFDTPTINEVPLDQIFRIRELAGYYLFMIGSNQFFPIPKTAFASPQEEMAFIGEVKRKAGIK